MSDARSAAGTVALAALLPPGSGIVLRHDALPQGARWRLARRLARVAKARGLKLLIAGLPAEARRWGPMASICGSMPRAGRRRHARSA